jgi:hypothetical protein
MTSDSRGLMFLLFLSVFNDTLNCMCYIISTGQMAVNDELRKTIAYFKVIP